VAPLLERQNPLEGLAVPGFRKFVRRSVCGIVIGMEGQESKPVVLTVDNGPETPRKANGVEARPGWAFARHDSFPAKAVIRVEGGPGQL